MRSGRNPILAGCRFSRSSSTLRRSASFAERGISVEQATEVFQVTPAVWIENPNPRVENSRWLIGPTRNGRFLTIVVDRDGTDHGLWHVMTAWDSSEAQVRLYRNAL